LVGDKGAAICGGTWVRCGLVIEVVNGWVAVLGFFLWCLGWVKLGFDLVKVC